MSVSKTFHRVLEAHVWRGMRRYIQTRVALCPVCQAHSGKVDRVATGEMPIPAYPMQMTGADLIGPFLPSPAGNRYVLTIIDHFTGWAEAIPLPDKTNVSVWHSFANRSFPIHVYPEMLCIDRGLEFGAQAWKKYLTDGGIDHRKTTNVIPSRTVRQNALTVHLKKC